MRNELKEEIREKIIDILFDETQEKWVHLLLELFATEKLKLLEEILKKGHGGGNWRRIISQKLEGLKK